MPYIVRNIDVLDIKPSTGIGISVPFDGSTGINTTFTTKDNLDDTTEKIKREYMNYMI